MFIKEVKKKSEKAEAKKQKVVQNDEKQFRKRSAEKKRPERINPQTGRFHPHIKAEDLFSIRIFNPPDSEDAWDLTSELEIKMYPEELVVRGFETIQVILRKIPKSYPLGRKASPKMIREMQRQRRRRNQGRILTTIDCKEDVDNFKLQLISQGRLDEGSDGLEAIPVIMKASKEVVSPFINRPEPDKPDEEVFTDSNNVLEKRLGEQASVKRNRDNNADASEMKPPEQEVRRQVDVSSEADIENLKNDKKIRFFEHQSALSRVLNAPEINKGNRRIFPGITRSELVRGIIAHPKRMASPRIRPRVKQLIQRRQPKQTKKIVNLKLPAAGSEIIVVARNIKTGEIRRKVIRNRPISLIPRHKVQMFRHENRIPKIQIVPLDVGLVNIQVTTRHRSHVSKVDVYRREISKRQFEDDYELLQTLLFKPGQKSASFNDVVADGTIYKYVAVPHINNRVLPVYSYRIFRTQNSVANTPSEPMIYAYQDGFRVKLFIRGLPREVTKVWVYRNSSTDGQEILVDGRFIGRRNSGILNFYDRPSPIEQTIEYNVRWSDELGIEHQFEDKPLVKFTARLGDEPGNISNFRIRFDPETSSVKITGRARVDDLYIADQDIALQNPDEKVLEAAARGLNLAKIIIRRIDLKSGDDEIIFSEIINPGLSKIETEAVGLSRIKFALEDNSEEAIEKNYTPIFSKRNYIYICRLAAYPLGVELRKVANIQQIAGIAEGDRLPYKYDPFIFDHPSNVELGIMPSRFSRSELISANEIAKTTDGDAASVYVPEIDSTLDIEIDIDKKLDYKKRRLFELECSIPTSILDDLDHVELYASTESLPKDYLIDRVFIQRNGKFTYYDYQMIDQVSDSVSYYLKGIGKDFRPLFQTKPSIVEQ